MNKVVGFIAFFILTCLIIAGVGFFIQQNKDNNNKQTINQTLNYTTVYLEAIDFNTNNQTNINFMQFRGVNIEKCLSPEVVKILIVNQSLFYKQYPELSNTRIDKKGCYVERVDYIKENDGELVKGLNKLEIVENSLNQIYYFKKGSYYTNMELWLPGAIKNNTKTNVIAHKVSDNVSIEVWGEFSDNTLNKNRLVLKSNRELRMFAVCFKHSYGIIDLVFPFEQTIIPSRLSDYDKCYQSGQSLEKNNNYTLSIDFQTDVQHIVNGDYLTLKIIDMDRYYDGEMWKFGYEDNNKIDLGSKDFEYNVTLLK